MMDGYIAHAISLRIDRRLEDGPDGQKDHMDHIKMNERLRGKNETRRKR